MFFSPCESYCLHKLIKSHVVGKNHFTITIQINKTEAFLYNFSHIRVRCAIDFSKKCRTNRIQDGYSQIFFTENKGKKLERLRNTRAALGMGVRFQVDPMDTT